MKPLIGITSSHDEQTTQHSVKTSYIAAVERAGGCPVLLPAAVGPESVLNYAERLDGFVFSGGGDVDPIWWGEEPLIGMGEIDPLRDEFELALAREILSRDKPGLFICRGIQVLNVAAGGELIQDLRTGLKHRQQAPRYHPTHWIQLVPGSCLAGLAGCRQVWVNSFHHQAAAAAAPGFKVTARASDGVIEAIESEHHRYILGVQWHPECMQDGLSDQLFRTLVQLAAGS
ncbi:MAG: gamma-glutamyl-gamma-aminobutyrate hydrolase family protein [Solirubrobacterales bacterium]